MRCFVLLVLGLVGCAHRVSLPASGHPNVVAENAKYDGTHVSFRLLVTAVDGPIALDRRVVENVHLTIVGVSSCDGRPLPHVVEDYFPRELGAEDVLMLEPGYWYGASLEYRLFKASGPGCVVAKYVFWAGVPDAKREPVLELRLEKSTGPDQDGPIGPGP